MSDEPAQFPGPNQFAITGQPQQHGPKPRELPPVLEGLDIWNLRRLDGWWWFDGRLPGASHTRSYRLRDGTDVIIAATDAPLMGVFELGGQSAAYATPGDVPYLYNVFTAADDIGPVGMAGLERAPATDALSRMRERTVAALVAQTLLRWCEDGFHRMPLFYVRSETDSSASAAAFTKGQAIGNLSVALQNWRDAAQAIDSPCTLLGLIVDVAGDELGKGFAQGVQILLTELRARAGGAREARVFMTFDVGNQIPIRDAMIRAQHDCVLSLCGPDTVMVAPGYMFDHERHGWLSDTGRLHKAEMIAAAMTFVPPARRPGIGGQVEEGWFCPLPLLADWEHDQIRLTCRTASGSLIIDDRDPFEAGDHAGFRVFDPAGIAQITDIRIDPEDGQSVLIRCNAKPSQGAVLFYAAGAEQNFERRHPVNTGRVRDDWHMFSVDGSDLHRWMLPCSLTISGV